MNLVCIEAYIHMENAASKRSLEKAGFRLEGCVKKKWLIRNQFCDVNHTYQQMVTCDFIKSKFDKLHNMKAVLQMKVLQHRLFPSLCNRIAWKSENRGRYGGERPSMTDPQDRLCRFEARR